MIVDNTPKPGIKHSSSFFPWRIILMMSILCVTSMHLHAQFNDERMLKKEIGCSDIAENSSLLFVKFVQKNQLDSARLLLEYWESKCGQTEPFFRAKTLLSIDAGDFEESMLPESFLHLVYIYKGRMNMIQANNVQFYDTYPTYFGNVPPGQQFDRFTIEYARRIRDRFMAGSVSYLLCDLYGGNENEFFAKLQTPLYSSTLIHSTYIREVKENLDKTEWHYSGIMGLWIPTGSLSQIGLHPEIGFQLGAKHRKMNFDATITLKFLNAPQDYQARRTKSNDTVVWTNYFFGAYIGIETGRDILAKNGHEIQITGGLAADGFDALKEDKELNLDSESAWSYNFNLGVSYRYYLSDTFYLGIRCKYNLVDYTLNRVVGLTGNTVTVQFLIGKVNNQERNANLRSLDYPIRK